LGGWEDSLYLFNIKNISDSIIHSLTKIKKNFGLIPLKEPTEKWLNFLKRCLLPILGRDTDLLRRMYNLAIIKNGPVEKQEELRSRYKKYLYLICLKCNLFIQVIKEAINFNCNILAEKMMGLDTDSAVISYLSDNSIDLGTEPARPNSLDATRFNEIISRLNVLRVGNFENDNQRQMLIKTFKTLLIHNIPKVHTIYKTLISQLRSIECYGHCTKSLIAFSISLTHKMRDLENDASGIDVGDSRDVIDDLQLTDKIIAEFKEYLDIAMGKIK
jgi:hypothetical protein